MKIRNFRYWYWDRIAASVGVTGILIWFMVTPR